MLRDFCPGTAWWLSVFVSRCPGCSCSCCNCSCDRTLRWRNIHNICKNWQQNLYLKHHFSDKKCRKFRQIGITYSFRQCDFVQLHGFLCLTPDDSYFSSGGSCLMLGLTSSGSSSGGNISSSRLARLAPPLKLFCFGVTTRLIAWFYMAG